ncbi:MAG: Transcriptional regulator, AcrR family [Candidatus Burkholderia crenata]|nr:MAG: Transcriptional regulator, AcrR family [Candidatus Burkholderia crenata]
MLNSADETDSPCLTREQSRDQTRQRLLDAAQAVFMKKGFVAASVEDIVAAGLRAVRSIRTSAASPLCFWNCSSAITTGS